MKKTHEVFVNEMKIKNPSISVVGQYSETHQRIKVSCKACNYSWSPTPHTLLAGIGCPACSGRVPIKGKNDFATIHPELLDEWDYLLNEEIGIRPEELTARSGKKVHWKCRECGFDWVATPDRRVSGRGCPNCGRRKQVKSRIKSLISNKGSLAEIHPELLGEWDWEINEKLGLDPKRLTSQSNYMAWWKCKKCRNGWQAVITNRVKGVGCPVCANRKIVVGCNDLTTTHKELLIEWEYEKNKQIGVSPEEVTAGSKRKVFWRCKFCEHVWEAYIYSRTGGTGCPKCSQRWQSSIPEQTIIYYLKKIYPNTISRYKASWLGLSELDIYVPDLFLGIEYDGQAWHQDVEKDHKKNLLCKEHGIRLLHIREPLCPALPDDCWVYIRTDKSLKSIDKMVVDVLNMIKKGIDTDIECDVCFVRDRAEIVLASGYHEVDNSIALIPELKAQWDYELNGGLKPEFFSGGSETKVYWKCLKCNRKWFAAINDRTRGRGCPFCAKKRTVEGETDLRTLYPELMEEWDVERNDAQGVKPEKIAPSSKKEAHWICRVCGWNWKARISNRVYEKAGCPNCWRKRRVLSVQQLTKDGSLIGTYESAAIAGESLGISSQGIRSVCAGHRKSYKSYIWKYIERQ